MKYFNRSNVPIFASFIFLVALTVIIGWYFDIPCLISITPSMTAMNPVTAVTFLLISKWLFFRSIREGNDTSTHPIEKSIAVLVFLVGLLKLLEYADISDMHIDQLLFPAKLNKRILHNAIAPATATLFLLFGIVLMNSYKTNRIKRTINDIVLFTAFLISYFGMIGFIFGLEPFYRVGPFMPMAVTTAACFIVLIIALFLTIPDGNLAKVFFSENSGGKLVRRAIPVVLLLPPIFGYSRLLLHIAQLYNVEYSIAIDTAFLVLVVLLLIFYYGKLLNKKDNERKATEKAVIQSEEKYRSLVFALKEGVVSFNKKGEILFCNQSFSEITGYAQDELVGENIIKALVPEEDKLISHKGIAERLKGIPEDYEIQIVHKDGTKKMVSINAIPIIKEGEPVSFLSTLIDITERKKREEEIEAFSASAAHDLYAPLARLEGIARQMLDDSKEHLSIDDVEYIDIILKTTTDMRTLLKDLLLFSRLGAEKIGKVPIDMNQMVHDIINAAPHSSALINVDNLPAGYGDPGAIKQVWTNVIFNAIKYSSKKENAEVLIGFTTLNGKNVYYVKDNGAGFSMSEYPKLFTPFTRLHSNFEGNGLGLPIVKRIIEKHGGNIWAESEKNKGATFYFTI